MRIKEKLPPGKNNGINVDLIPLSPMAEKSKVILERFRARGEDLSILTPAVLHQAIIDDRNAFTPGLVVLDMLSYQDNLQKVLKRTQAQLRRLDLEPLLKDKYERDLNSIEALLDEEQDPVAVKQRQKDDKRRFSSLAEKARREILGSLKWQISLPAVSEHISESLKKLYNSLVEKSFASAETFQAAYHEWRLVTDLIMQEYRTNSELTRALEYYRERVAYYQKLEGQ